MEVRQGLFIANMYYQEKIVNGVLCCTHTPKGKWIPLSIQELSKRVVSAESTLISWKDQEKSRNYFRDADMAIGLL